MKLIIPLGTGNTLGKQVFNGLRSAIVSGALKPGDRLPSSRDLADQLGVSRTIVLGAFEQLLAEGYAVARRGSGTFVAAIMTSERTERAEAKIPLSIFATRAADVSYLVQPPPRPARSLRYDFAYGRSDLEDFPFEHWRRLLGRRARKLSIKDLDYGQPAGDSQLTEVLRDHLQRSRGVICDPCQIIITSGSQQAIDLIIRTLIDTGDRIAIENPQYQGTRASLLAAGVDLDPVDVDAWGLDPDRLPKAAKALFLTPSHQFPTGTLLPLARRLRILDWADRCGAFIVEDDYDGEFRYDGQPLESLQGLDTNGRVIYVGTFSRTVFASLRIGYLVVPKSLVSVFTTMKWLADRHTASLEQRVLADFISDGTYERYLRRVRRSLRAKRDALLAAITNAWGSDMLTTGAASGAHVTLWPGRHFEEAETIDAAARLGVGVYPLSTYYLSEPIRGLLLGYSQLRIREIEAGINRLAQVVALS